MIIVILIMGVGIAVYDLNRTHINDKLSVTHTAETGSLQVRENSDSGITVVVTPPDFATGAAMWNFDVVMSTHMYELGGYDLKTMATLVDATGKTYKAVSWKPDAKEGHHIGGTLQFDRIVVHPKDIIVLNIVGVGTAGDRVFQWSMQ